MMPSVCLAGILLMILSHVPSNLWQISIANEVTAGSKTICEAICHVSKGVHVCADDIETPTAAYSSSYSSGFRLLEPNLDGRRNSLADLSDIFDFPVVMPDALHGAAAPQQNGSVTQPIRTSLGGQNGTGQARVPSSDDLSSPAAE